MKVSRTDAIAFSYAGRIRSTCCSYAGNAEGRVSVTFRLSYRRNSQTATATKPIMKTAAAKIAMPSGVTPRMLLSTSRNLITCLQVRLNFELPWDASMNQPARRSSCELDLQEWPRTGIEERCGLEVL